MEILIILFYISSIYLCCGKLNEAFKGTGVGITIKAGMYLCALIPLTNFFMYGWMCRNKAV